MGEAKRRGSYEERVSQAKDKKKESKPTTETTIIKTPKISVEGLQILQFIDAILSGKTRL